MRRSLALLLTLALIAPASALAADDGGDVITGEPASIEADTAGTPKMLDDDEEATTSTVNYSVTYQQTSARSILDMVNDFRQSSDAWYWNEDDVTTTDLEGQLSNYTYDYDLEKIAMQRAAEIAIYYSHTRPDGETCWTAYSDMDYSSTARAENIAAGYSSADAVFVGWREDDDKYEDQGHRRNMLSSTYTAIGIACVKYNGCYYWVQEFSNNVNSSSFTSVNDSETDVSAKVAIDEVSSSTLSMSPDSYVLSIGGTDSLPTISGTITLTQTYTGKTNKDCSITSVDATWSSTDNSIASVSGDTVTGLKSGETTLTASALGEDFSVPVSVAMISGATVTLSEDSYTYDGSEKKPDVTVQFGSSTLTLDKDYTVSYSNNTNAGTAAVTVTGTGDYEGSQTVEFTINKASQTLEASLVNSSIEIGATTSITASGQGSISYASSDTSVATVDEDGVVTGVGYGTATITVTAAGNDNYNSASTTLTIEVTKETKESQELTASLASSSILVGGTTTITASAEGKINYASSNISVATVDEDGVVTGVGAGTATITVTAEETETYEPASKTLSITVTKASQSVSASIASSSIVAGKTTTITASGIGTISYKSSNTSVATVSSSGVVTGVGAGTATITVTAAGNDSYNSASKTISITVTKASQTLTAKAKSSSIVVGKTTTITVSGKGTITYSSGDKNIATVSSSGKVTAKAPGKVKITVKAAGTSAYNSASKTVTITVNPKAAKLSSVKNSSSKKAAVKWKKVSGVTGYQIQYATNSGFTKNKKSTTVKGASKVSKTLSKLKKGKTYYVRIRTYKTVSGTKYYSSWSSAKKVKIKK